MLLSDIIAAGLLCSLCRAALVSAPSHAARQHESALHMPSGILELWGHTTHCLAAATCRSTCSTADASPPANRNALVREGCATRCSGICWHVQVQSYQLPTLQHHELHVQCQRASGVWAPFLTEWRQAASVHDVTPACRKARTSQINYRMLQRHTICMVLHATSNTHDHAPQ
jgi:hypothetical protein